MAITTSGTTLTFNDSTTQTTAPVNTSANVNSVSAGTGISVNSTTGAVTVTNSGVTSAVAGTGISVSGSTGAVTITNGGVTSVAAGTGISVSGSTGGVTITNSSPGAPTTYNAVGTYAYVGIHNPYNYTSAITSGGTYPAGTQQNAMAIYPGCLANSCGWGLAIDYNGLSGTWRWNSGNNSGTPTGNTGYGGIAVRIS